MPAERAGSASAPVATPATAPAATAGGAPLRWLALVTFAIYLGWGIVNPVLPLYAAGFGVGSLAVGVLVASFSVTSFGFDLYGGRLSDRYGARRMACGGALLVAASSVAAGAAPNFGLLLLSRALTGAGSALYVTAAMNILARTAAPGQMARAMSAYQAALMAGVGFGPLLGGVLGSAFNYRVPLFAYAGLAALCAAFSARTLPGRLPTAAALAGNGAGQREAPLLRDGAFLTAVALAAAVFVVRAGVLSTLVPLFAKERLHFSGGLIGLALTIAALVNVVVLPHVGRFADRRHRRVAVLVGLGAGLVGLLLLTAPANAAALFASMVALGVCTGYAGVAPAAIIADVAPPGRSGTAMGLYRMGVDFGSVAGPLCAGQLIAVSSYPVAFAAMAVPVALMVPLALRLRDTRRVARPDRANATASLDSAPAFSPPSGAQSE